MIYKGSFLHRELKLTYAENETGRKKIPVYGLFLGLLTFAVHFLLQTVYESVLTEILPEVMLPGYFSVAYTFSIVALLFFVVYFLVQYKFFTFAEIQDNSWYILSKASYNPFLMILSKLAARLLFVIFIYTLGFLVSIGFTVFLKYTFVPDYLFPVYLSGLIDILCIVSLTMAGSLFIKEASYARYFIFGSLILFILTKLFSNYYNIVSDRVLMQNIHNMFDFSKSIYLPVVFVTIILSLAACIIGAGAVSKYYFVPQKPRENIVYKNYLTQSYTKPKTDRIPFIGKVMNAFVSVILLCAIFATIAFNGVLLAVSVASPEKEFALGGVIPYVFQSSTMQPAIHKNDLALFNKVGKGYVPKEGDIVLFKYKNEVFVQQVLELKGDQSVVDFTYYPEMTQKDALKRTIENDSIYGVYSHSNRLLGALILFANTFMGRLLFLLLPAVLVFFYKPITAFFKKLSGGTV